MLTSSSQYLRPEYLTPLPTTLDAKKSPLALLAQTCSQIGADAPNAKLVGAAAADKKGAPKGGKPAKSPAESPSRFKPYEGGGGGAREKSKSPEERAASAASASSSSRARTPAGGGKGASGVRCASNASAASQRDSPAEEASKGSGGAATPPAGGGAFKPAAAAALPASYHHLAAYPPLAMDLVAGLGPYLGYARLKRPPDAAAALCRDPYCTGCGAPKSPACPAGCTQCEHHKASGYAAAYAHAQLAALAAAAHLPYVCNWIAGDAAYCGKRFPSSEELLQHLRTHTSAADALLPPPPPPPLSPRYHPYGKPPPPAPLLPPALALAGYPPYLVPYPGYPRHP